MQPHELLHKAFGKLRVIKIKEDGNFLICSCECGRTVTRTPEELTRTTIQEQSCRWIG